MPIRLPLETERLILREFMPDDWEAVQRYACDPEVTRFMPWGPNTEDQTREFVRRVIDSAQANPRVEFGLAVALKTDGQLIGACHAGITHEHMQACIGYVYHKDWWGQGYATEAARALVRFGFEQLGLHRIYASCDAENIGSARVLEKAGMRQEGRFLQAVWTRGQWRDQLRYAILEQEWAGQ
jgi:RimJ/RimL family protein N-acetyltransferase